ncbi:MAG: hypothetical protein GC153_13630 [Alphaproteobacteria bacterium]|nr:hypothetical protein [Alphaproteobacteria bacterium]
MSGPLVLLERFDRLPVRAAPRLPPAKAEDDAADRAREEGYAEGYAAGRAAAEAKGAEDTRLLAAVAAALEAQAAAAPDKIAAEASAALVAFLTHVLPKLSEAGFAIEAAAAFTKIAETAPDLAIEISTAPDHAKRLEEWIARFRPDAKLTVRADNSLQGAEANAAWVGGGADFNWAAAVEECLSALNKAVKTFSNGDN